MGGNYNNGTNAGPFYLNGNNAPSNTNSNLGSRLLIPYPKLRVVFSSPLGENFAAGTRPSKPDMDLKGREVNKKNYLRPKGDHSMKNTKRIGYLMEKLCTRENALLAIEAVNEPRKKNKTAQWVESTKEARADELCELLRDFHPKKPRTFPRYDSTAGKWREINEPALWPDQYVHHMIVQVLAPVLMRGMDFYCCGSIPGRGPHRARKAIEKWLEKDQKGTKYAAELDIKKFYPSLSPREVMRFLRRKIKDEAFLGLIWRIIKDGIPDIAQARYEDHYPDKGPGLKIGKDHRLARYLEAAIKGGNRSPEAALGEIKAKGLVFDTEISVRTLYRYIDLGLFLGITNKDLPHKAAKKRGYRRVRAARAPKGLSIEQRPEEINSRETFGHWEMDTVQGIQKSRPRLLVLTERLSRHEIMIPIKTNTTESVVKALNTLERKYGALFYKVFRSITVDNGPEFADCAGMEKACRRKGARTTVYYCHPYSSWERGSNERQNGMIRRKHPKGTDFATIPASTLKKTEEWINNYPRKIFNFHTAAEVFEACMNSL